jgi:hypothetical protein
VNRQDTRAEPQTSRTFSCAVSITRAWKEGKRSQVIAVSKVSLRMPIATNVSRM